MFYGNPYSRVTALYVISSIMSLIYDSGTYIILISIQAVKKIS